MTEPTKPGRATLGVHGGAPHREPGAPVVAPLIQSATFFGGRGEPSDRLRYSRYGNNPNQEGVAAKLAALEGTESALVLSSGMGATAMTVLACVEAGEHVVASRYLYGSTISFLAKELPRRGVDVTFVDPDEEGSWRKAVRNRTRLLFLEVPTNPTLRVFDPRIPAAVSKEIGATFAVDGTFASPSNIRLADLGTDAVIHSATKYLGGHSDLIAGVVSGPAELIGRIRAMMKLYGPAADPHMVWLLDRGMKTLDMRIAQHNRNALALARWLDGHPAVEHVHYPGLEDHPDHALATELMEGYGGMLSFVLAGGGAAADAFMDRLELVIVAPSLGGVESLVSQPRYTSNQHQSEEERLALGIPDGFVRMSVGVEDLDDLRNDLRQALAGV